MAGYPRRMLRLSLVAFLCLVAACARQNRALLTVARPLPETGLISADLSGNWRITAVDASVHSAPGVSNEGGEHDALGGLVSMVPGAVLHITGGELHSAGEVVLRLSPSQREFTTFYLNQVNDRFVLFGRHTDTHQLADGGVTILEVGLGTVDRDHLLGMVYYRGGGFFPAATVTHHLARVALTREP
jgi:hypothetical protein